MNCYFSAVNCTNVAFFRNIRQTGHMDKRVKESSTNLKRISKDGENSALTYMNRKELHHILNIYGRMVSAGIWKDYAIDTLKEEAIFSIFKRSTEMPIYRIIKQPSLSHKQGAWRIVSMSGQILKRSKDLAILLKYFDKLSLKVIHN